MSDTSEFLGDLIYSRNLNLVKEERGPKTNKYTQQGTRGIFVGFPEDSSGWLFYVPSTRRTYISLDAVFDENFTSPLRMPDLPFQGAFKIRRNSTYVHNTETLTEVTGPPTGTNEEFPDELIMIPPSKQLRKDNDALTCYEKNKELKENEISSYDKSVPLENQDIEETKAYFTEMRKSTDLPYSEYLHIAHGINVLNKAEDRVKDNGINLSDFLPEPRSLTQILRLSPHTKERWGEAIRAELTGLFDCDTFSLTEKPFPADEIIPTKLALKTKLNSYGGLDKLKARICLRGDMQIKDANSNSWSPTASTRLLKCLIADAARNKTTIYQLDFIQAFIQSEAKRRMFVILDKEYEQFCPKLAGHFGRPLRLKKCLYGADFSGKSWYETLDLFLTNELKFTRSRVEGCLYILRKENHWIKLINYVDDALYYSNDDNFRIKFEQSLKKRFNLSLLGKAKWYLGIKITQTEDDITLSQEQYIKNIVSRFEKSFKHQFKVKETPLPTNFIPSKKDCPTTDNQTKEVKLRFGNLHYRSVIGALLYISCCTRIDIAYAVNKLAKFSNNPGIIHYRALLHLVGFIKNTANKQLKFYSDYRNSPIYKVLQENNIEIDIDTILTFSDSSWNDCIDTGRSTGGNCTIVQGGPVDHSSHLPIPVAMSSGEAEYISAAAACMRASHLRMLNYDLRYLGTTEYDGNNIKSQPAKIIIDNEAAICMAKCNKDTAGNRHVARRFHYVRQGTVLKEHEFQWINSKFQLADILTKVGTKASFNHLWSLVLHNDE